MSRGYIRKTTKKLKMRALTPFHRAFILHYMANGNNATRAYISAGGSPLNADVNGWQLIHTNEPVSLEIRRLAELAAKKNEISAAYILGSLKGIADACKAHKVEVDENGVEHEKGVVDSSGANRALELLGKNQRLFVENIELTQTSALAEVPDEELLKMVKNADGEKKKKSKKTK